MKIESITLQTTVEDLIDAHPEAVTYLMGKGIRCMQCGEPVWGGIGELIHGKGLDKDDHVALFEELKAFLSHSSAHVG
jgi:hypothetical protein